MYDTRYLSALQLRYFEPGADRVHSMALRALVEQVYVLRVEGKATAQLVLRTLSFAQAVADASGTCGDTRPSA
jgi:hypothetical protein